MTDPIDPAAAGVEKHVETDAERRARHRFDTETAAGPASIAPTEPGPVDDADEGTIMVDRVPTPATEPDDGPEDGTIVVDRRVEPEDGTIVVDRRVEPEDGTVVVDRSDPDDGTVVVDRTSDPDDGTVVVDRSTQPDDGTLVVDRAIPAADDGTLVVERPAAPAKRGPVMRTLPRRGARREVTLAPGEGANKTATLAPGAGAIAAYDTRAIPAAPTASSQIELGPEASRANAPSMPSIAKQSRRRGLIALAATAGAVVVSVIGLVLVINALISG